VALRPCYRATCDAPGCTTTQVLTHERSGPARTELEALGWRVIPHQAPPQSGAPRIFYACHSRVAEIVGNCERFITRCHVQAADWQEPWAKRLRAAGAIP